MHSNSDSGHWPLNPELQEKFNRVVAQTRRLQAELGITPRTLEQRYQDYLTRKQEEARKSEELAKFNNAVGIRRPPPKWKI